MRKWINLVEKFGSTELLYHGTAIPNAASIVSQGSITAGDYDDGPSGISLTRQFGVANDFAHAVEAREIGFLEDYGPAVTTPGRPCGAVLVFNRAALAAQHTIEDYRWDNADAEHEERVLVSSFRLDGVCIAIQATIADCDWWIQELTEQHGHGEDFTRLIRCVEELKTSKLRVDKL